VAIWAKFVNGVRLRFRLWMGALVIGLRSYDTFVYLRVTDFSGIPSKRVKSVTAVSDKSRDVNFIPRNGDKSARFFAA
jgi:hypothetical protein